MAKLQYSKFILELEFSQDQDPKKLRAMMEIRQQGSSGFFISDDFFAELKADNINLYSAKVKRLDIYELGENEEAPNSPTLMVRTFDPPLTIDNDGTNFYWQIPDADHEKGKVFL